MRVSPRSRFQKLLPVVASPVFAFVSACALPSQATISVADSAATILVMNQTPCPNYAMPLPEGWQHALNPLEGISLVLWPKSAGFQNADRRIFVIIRPSTETPAEFQRADAEQHRSAGRIVEVLKTESISSATMGPLVQSALLQQVRIHTAQQESFDQMITLSVKGAGNSSYIFNTWLACETRQCFDQWAERHKTAIAGRFVVFQGAAPGAL